MFKSTVLYLLTTLILLSSCGQKQIELSVLDDPKIKLNEKLSRFFKEELYENLDFTKEEFTYLKELYARNGNRLFWCNDSSMTKKGITALSYFHNSNAIGLPKNRLKSTKFEKIKKKILFHEFRLSLSLAQAKVDLEQGFLDVENKKYKPVKYCSPDVCAQLIKQMDTVKNPGLWFGSFANSPHFDYKMIAGFLFYQVYGKQISEEKIEIPEPSKDSAQAYKQAKVALFKKGFTTSETPDEEQFREGIKKCQEAHAMTPDGDLDLYTREILAESTQHQIDRAILSLERWRWRKKFGERYIWVNIPEFKLRLFYKDTMLSVHRVVTGKRDTKTPELKSTLHSIVALPYWTQPHSIATEEFLPAQRASGGYASKNNYRIYRGETEVSASSINWSKYSKNNFPFRVKQDPGAKNALGLVKFEFHNKFGVYIHDTPQKRYFNYDVRAYSHGCVRCQDPDSLARIIIRREENKKFTADSLDSLIARETHQAYALRKPYVIDIQYITVALNTDNTGIVYHLDIYGRDDDYLKMFHN